MATTVTSKGEVTIPETVRKRLGIVPGSEVDFLVEEDGRVVLRKVGLPTELLEKWRGAAGPGPSTDEILAMTRGEP